MNILETWRTIIVAVLTALTGVAMKFGFVFPEGFVLDTAETLIAAGAIFGVLRAVTKKPLASEPLVNK